MKAAKRFKTQEREREKSSWQGKKSEENQTSKVFRGTNY